MKRVIFKLCKLMHIVCFENARQQNAHTLWLDVVFKVNQFECDINTVSARIFRTKNVMHLKVTFRERAKDVHKQCEKNKDN